MSSRFKQLFEPISIGTMELKNRIVMCPMCTAYSSLTGEVTPRLIDYYAERAKGGAGLIIVEGTTIESILGNSRMLPRIFIDSDFFIAGLSRLADRVHLYGAKIAIQFQHHGRMATPLRSGEKSVAPSDFPGRVAAGARALTVPEIKDLEEAFAEAARRAKTAGFDAIVINGGCGVLIHQFLSPLTNRRTDEYGGELEGRMRFISEMIDRIHHKVGLYYPIIFDHPADDMVNGGITIEEGKEIARRLEKLGVAAIRMHTGVRDDPRLLPLMVPPAAIPYGPQVDYAEQTKKVLKYAKVMVGRRINDPAFANQVLEEGKADLIVLGRPLVADPEFPRKASEGRTDEIRKCIACNHCWTCYTSLLPFTCTVNPAAGEEKLFEIVPTRNPRKVLIVGGGPAGMEAARVAMLRGHSVTLYEKSQRLGGQLNLASIPPHKEEVKNLMHYFTCQMDTLGVKVRLGEKVTKKLIKEQKPDAVILATGATPLMPGIPGIERENVVTYSDALTGKAKVGQKVIVAGGGTIGCEVAEFLAEKGKSVTIVEQLPDVGMEIEVFTKTLLLDRLARLSVSVVKNTKITEIKDGGALVSDKDSKTRFLEAGTIVLSVGSMPNRQFEGLEEEAHCEVYRVGDCIKSRTILEAIREGWWTATRI